MRGEIKAVSGDIYNICERIKEIDRNLFIVHHEGHERPFVVMENCVDGEERMVSRYERLDASILEDLQRMLRIPFEQRMETLIKKIDAENAAKEREWEESEAHEKFIWDMKNALRDSNIASPTSPIFFKGK